ncbi:hypothetical protein [Streptomyces sp. NPDC127038]|uniref:hypothetical protein n=1 Tax=Streptomyces sp. NPDC127038 TaxID=3347114 RepID=UPI003664FD92
MTDRYRHRPIEIAALQWNPGSMIDAGAIVGTLLGNGVRFRHPSGMGETTTLLLDTPEGEQLAQPGDWIVRPASGDWAVLAAADFAERYEPAAVSVPASAPTDETALRDRIAEALRPGSRDRSGQYPEGLLRDVAAVLAVLPANQTTDRAAALTRAADIAEDVAESLRKHHEFERSNGALDVMTELRRMAAVSGPHDTDDTTGQAETQDPAFVTRVLEIFSMSHADAYDDLLWRVDNGTVHLNANVSDVFAWGGADCEPITPDTLPVLEQAYADLKALGAEGFTAELYAARQRSQRPQGAAYPDARDPAWREVSALYDACGPERELGLGNPKAAPAHRDPSP